MEPIRLPPGQALTRKFPVVGESEPAELPGPGESWNVRIDGRVERSFDLSWIEYLALPHRERTIDIHCVTGWTRLGTTIRGIPLVELLERSRPEADARFVRFESRSARRHDTSLPLDVALADTWLVHEVDGAPLSIEHGGPLRTVTPSRYFYKSLKWLARIELLAEDRLGFWERESAYHNVGDPWRGDQRFTTGSIEPEELEKLRTGRQLAPWRLPRRVVLAADLSGWSPVDRDLSRLQIKNSNLRGARLAGCVLRGVNFSLSDLRDADLRGADGSGSDFEGADFTGADLRGADFSDAALSATRFVSADGGRAAQVADLRVAGASGLLEDQERFLRAHGARF